MASSPIPTNTSSPNFSSNRAGPSKGKQRAYPLIPLHGGTRVTRAMSRSNAPHYTLDPAALNNIPEEDEQRDRFASSPILPCSQVPGALEADSLGEVDPTHSLGHTDSPFGCRTERLDLPRLTIRLPGALSTLRTTSRRRLPSQTSPGPVGDVNPLRCLLSPAVTSTPRNSHAGNVSMRIQDLLNSVPRYPAAAASSCSGNSEDRQASAVSSRGPVASHQGRSRADMSVSRLLSDTIARPRRASRSPDGAPPHNRRRTSTSFLSPPAFASLLPAFQSPQNASFVHDLEPLVQSQQPRSSRHASHRRGPSLALVSHSHLGTQDPHRWARSRSPPPRHPRRHDRSQSPSSRRYRSRSRSPTERRSGSSAVALPDPSEQDHTMAVSQTVRILPEVITALRKGWSDHISLAYFNPKMVCSNPANRRRTDNTVSLLGTDLRIKSKDLSHFDLARVSTDDFGEIAKTMPKALEAFLITEKSHGRTGSDHALAIADFV
ncbi:hypothetical protein F5876DRAFT_74031 [Lentinula aff. lateritia]|uniref:Uncharacterized protein n=1 Tax=Lentinula aff. lateritia TaxID=2804960 RepID=A0ACC1U8E8_9AGAR|nr:hypothetical protein F5876DRAFT_74031 [Lentinula aff. lateritia]